MKQKNKKRGFTLVELLVVIAILAILATVSIVGYTAFLNKARQSNCNNEAYQVQQAIQAATMVPDGEYELGSATAYAFTDTTATGAATVDTATKMVVTIYVVRNNASGVAGIYTDTITYTKATAGSSNAWGEGTTVEGTTALTSGSLTDAIKNNADFADLTEKGDFTVTDSGKTITFKYNATNDPDGKVSAVINLNA